MLSKKIDIQISTQFFHRYFGKLKNTTKDTHIFDDDSLFFPLISPHALHAKGSNTTVKDNLPLSS